MITLGNWEHRRAKQRARMARSATQLRRRGIRIVTEFDEALLAQDKLDEANEWPTKWGGF